MFVYEGDNKKVKEAVAAANNKKLVNYVSTAIRGVDKFDMCDALPVYLAPYFKSFLMTNDVEVEVYYPRWRFSKAYGYFSRSKPKTIHINGYKLKSMPLYRVVSLMCHEAGHMMDHFDAQYSYGHGDNSPKGKENTFQYSLNRFVNAFYGVYPKPKRRRRWYNPLTWF